MNEKLKEILTGKVAPIFDIPVNYHNWCSLNFPKLIETIRQFDAPLTDTKSLMPPFLKSSNFKIFIPKFIGLDGPDL